MTPRVLVALPQTLHFRYARSGARRIEFASYCRADEVHRIAAGSVTEPDVGQDEMRTLVRRSSALSASTSLATTVRRMADGRAAKTASGAFVYGSPRFG